MIWYCLHCGKERPLKPGYPITDDRYAIVVCGDGDYIKDFLVSDDGSHLFVEIEPAKSGGTDRPAVSDPALAKRIRKEKAAAARKRRDIRNAMFDGRNYRELTQDERRALR